jgi:PAS domain S-box-containing protein
MGQEMKTIHTSEDTEYVDTDRDVILTLSLEEEILYCNKESERLTGYTKEEIVYNRFEQTLIPVESMNQWKDFFDLIRQSMWIDNIVLPLKTKNDQTHLLTWTGFLVKDQHGTVKDICIFGKPLNTETKPKQPSDEATSPLVTSTDEPVGAPQFDAVLSQDESQESAKQQVGEGSSPVLVSPDEPIGAPQFDAVLSQDESQESAKQQAGEGSSPALVSSDEPVEVPEFEAVAPKDASEEIPPQKNTEMIMKHRLKKILFASKKREEEPPTDHGEEQFITPLVTMGKLLETTSQKLDFVNDTLKELSQKYETITSRVAELEKKDRRWEKKHNTKQESQPPPEEETQQETQQPLEEQKEPDQNKATMEEPPSENEKLGFFSDPFGFKRQHRELDIKQQQLEIRSKELEAGEEQLQRERTYFNARVEEFSKWQEKLLLLEKAIETRRQELMKQEDMVLLQSTAPSISQEKNLAEQKQERGAEDAFFDETNETLENIPQSAAILQRGILKQVNAPFRDLLGYPTDEILEKSFFDFIALEGLADIEKYYLDRLKGDMVSMYNTVLSVKDNNKIPVEVTIKQTIYHGEKAEILIINHVGS